MMEPSKIKTKKENKWLLWGLIGFTGILLVTAVILFLQLKKPVTPPLPKPRPTAAPQLPPVQEVVLENVCEVNFTVAGPSPSPLACNMPCNLQDSPAECGPGLSCLNTSSDPKTAIVKCRNPQCATDSDCVCSSPSPSPSPEPTACFDTCEDKTECETDLDCITVGGDKRCVNPNCTSETDCVCPGVKKACFDKCENDNECESRRRCMTIPNTNDKRCVNPSCISESDCSCEQAQVSPSPSSKVITYASPTPPTTLTKGGQPELPEAGFAGPAILGVVAGLLMILFGILF